MHDFETLIAEHDHMDDLVAELAQLVIGEKDVAGALAIRTDLSLSLDDHLSKEDAFLYDALINATKPDLPAAIARFHSSFADLAADWSDYLLSWDAQCIASSWDEFAEQTIAIMARLRARIAEENDLLYPMALGANHIRLRSAA